MTNPRFGAISVADAITQARSDQLGSDLCFRSGPIGYRHRKPVADAEAEYSFGSVTGRLEQLNVHDGLNRFSLWPKNVRVYGRLKFPVGENYPREIDQVSDVEVYEPDDELPRLNELRGIAPDATGGMNIRDFVESLYDGD